MKLRSINSSLFYNFRLLNSIISKLFVTHYCLNEPIKLLTNRQRYESEYQDPIDDPLVTMILATYNRGKLLVERTFLSIIE